MFTDRRHEELVILVVTFAVSSISFQKHLTLREMGSQKVGGLYITFSEKGHILKGDMKSKVIFLVNIWGEVEWRLVKVKE